MEVPAVTPGAVLEIGHLPFLARCRPDVVRFVAVGTRSSGPEATLVVAGAGFVHGATALFYDPRPGGLAEAVREALADPARLARIATTARAHALANLTPEAIAARVLAESLGT